MTSQSKQTVEEKGTDCILKNFRFVKDELYVKPLVELFFQSVHLDEDDREEILGQQSRRYSVDCLLRNLLRFKADSFDIFLQYLRQTEQDHIADALTKEQIVIENLPDSNLSNNGMETSILANLDLLCDDLEPKEVGDYFLVHRVFTVDEYKSIISHRTRRQKADEMVRLLLEHLPQRFLVLKQIYKKMGKENNTSSLHDVSSSH